MAEKPPVPLGTYIGAGKVKGNDVHYTIRLLEKKICWLDYKEETAQKQKNGFHAEGAFVVDATGAKPIMKFTVGGLPGQPRVGDVYEFTAETSPAGPPVLCIDGVFLQPQSDTLSEEAKVCATCGKKIEGPAVGYGGAYYHKDCFACSKCNKSLAGVPFKKEDDGSKICQSCQPKKYCEACKKQIVGQMMSVGEKVYHPACFKCEVCDSAIEGSYFVKGDKIHCKACLDASKLPTKTAIKRTCRGCRKPIEGEIMVEGEKGDVFHEECFSCTDCNCKLEKETYKYRDSKYRCSACDEKAPKEVDKTSPPCAICTKPCPTGDDHLRTMDGTIIHWSCFTCSTCKTPQTAAQHGGAKPSPADAKQLRTKVNNAKKGMFVCEGCLTGTTKEAMPSMPLGTYCGKKPGEGGNSKEVAYAVNLQKDRGCWLDCTIRTAIDSSSWHSEGTFAEEVVGGKLVRVSYTVQKNSIGGGPVKGTIYVFEVDGEVLKVEGIRCSFQANATDATTAEYMKPTPSPETPTKVSKPEVKNASAPLPGEGMATKLMSESKGIIEKPEIDKSKTLGEAEKRINADDGIGYTKQEFLDYFGEDDGLRRWESSKAPPKCQPAPPAVAETPSPKSQPEPAPAAETPSGCFSLEDLQSAAFVRSQGLDPSKREEYLGDSVFQEKFGMGKEEFAKLPKWKRDKQKKDLGLF